MSNSFDDDNLFAEFCDDYFAECEEHLTIVRRGLLALDNFVNQPQVASSLLEELFRSFHSLKGMSGMIGVKEAEQVAHEMESYLRALREQQVILSQAGVDALIAGTKMLEQILAMRQSKQPAPDIESVIKQIAAVVVATGAGTSAAVNSSAHLTLKPAQIAQLNAAVQSAKQVWLFEFTPVSTLAERGVNVNKIRDRLQQNGELIHAAPRILTTGGIIFDFVVASDASESIFASWENDGITYTPFELNSPAETENSALSPNTVPLLQEEGSPTLGGLGLPRQNSLPSAAPTTSNVVRVDLAKLDDLMRMVGELVISRARLEDNLKKIETLVPVTELRALRETNLTLGRQLRDLRQGVMRVRLVPISEIFARMQFVVRDIAKESHKKVTLELSGQETEIDKFLVERMMDPLLHLVRNAVSHGLESEDERVRNGKSPQAKLVLRAATAGEMVVIEIEDDGRGVDIECITAKARQLGLIAADATLDINKALEIICSPGFSTREQADLTSGRGVGMAVVKNTVLELGGLLTLDSQPGEGTRFTIQLPLTLAIADALIVKAGGQTFAVPLAVVREVMEIQSLKVTALENNEIISYRGNVLPLLRLTRLFQLPVCSNSSMAVLVVGTGSSAVGIAVDRILNQREIVVRSLTDPFVQVPGISGATELGDGRVVLIIDASALFQLSQLLIFSTPHHPNATNNGNGAKKQPQASTFFC